MEIEKFVTGWLAAANSYDTTRYLAYYHPDAVLDDPSVGRKFIGHKGIAEYFRKYFIGYDTQTRLLKFETTHNGAKIEVEFTGSFPEGQIGGRFEVIFRDGKIEKAIADLM